MLFLDVIRGFMISRRGGRMTSVYIVAGGGARSATEDAVYATATNYIYLGRRRSGPITSRVLSFILTYIYSRIAMTQYKYY